MCVRVYIECLFCVGWRKYSSVYDCDSVCVYVIFMRVNVLVLTFSLSLSLCVCYLLGFDYLCVYGIVYLSSIVYVYFWMYFVWLYVLECVCFVYMCGWCT